MDEYSVLKELVARKMPVRIRLADGSMVSESEVIRDTLDEYIMLNSGIARVVSVASNHKGNTVTRYTVTIRPRN